MRHLVIVLCAVAVGYSSPIAQEDSVLRLVVGNFVNCMNSDLTLCLKVSDYDGLILSVPSVRSHIMYQC